MGVLLSTLQIRWQPGVTQVDAVAAHRDSFFQQELTLLPSLRDAPVGADDAMPWEAIVGCGKNAPDEARRAGVDVAIGTDKPSGNGAHPADDTRGARLVALPVRLNPATRTSAVTSSAHR
jgi:hypothetical protein